MELKYSDFKIGQELICIKQTAEGYSDTHEEFVPIECFSDLAYKRNLKLEEIGI